MSKPILLRVNVLSIRGTERYLLRRLVVAAQQELQPWYPDLTVDITEVGDPSEIGKHAFVLVQPSLVVEQKTVCEGRLPEKDEVIAWLRQAVQSASG